MANVLLVTNDFPPRRGGIQSYLENLVTELVTTGEHTVTVYAPTWKGAEDYDREAERAFRVVRHPTTLMIPEPSVARRMRRLIVDHRVETVWFGAAAPLALLSPLARQASPICTSTFADCGKNSWLSLSRAKELSGCGAGALCGGCWPPRPCTGRKLAASWFNGRSEKS